jgi:hypothetical protein
VSATKSKITETAEALAKAEQAVKEAKEAHRQAFRRALVDLCNEYGFYMEACGTEGASIDLLEVRPGAEVRLEDIPE